MVSKIAKQITSVRHCDLSFVGTKCVVFTCSCSLLDAKDNLNETGMAVQEIVPRGWALIVGENYSHRIQKEANERSLPNLGKGYRV
jgi:hypothetical protein